MAQTELGFQHGVFARSAGAVTRTLTLALAAGTMFTTVAGATEPAKLKTMTFQASDAIQAIHVISTDKKKWNAFKPGQILFSGSMNIEAKHRGRIISTGVAIGQCGPNTCAPGLVAFVQSGIEAKSWSDTRNINLFTGKLPLSGNGKIAVVPYGDQMVATCNQHLSTNGPTQRHTFILPMKATFLAYTRKNSRADASGTGSNTAVGLVASAQHGVSATFNVPVTCDPVLKSVGDVAARQPDFKVKSIALFRTTYSHAVSRPNPGTVCKKAKWLVRLGTSKAGPVKFKLWMKIGNAPMTSKVIEAWSKFDGNSKYKAEYSEWTSVSKTTLVQAMAEDMTNPIGQSTGWKKITLHCTGAGGGGLTSAPKPGDDRNAQAQAGKFRRPLTTARPQGHASRQPAVRPGRRLGQRLHGPQHKRGVARRAVRRDRESALQRRRLMR